MLACLPARGRSPAEGMQPAREVGPQGEGCSRAGGDVARWGEMQVGLRGCRSVGR